MRGKYGFTDWEIFPVGHNSSQKKILAGNLRKVNACGANERSVPEVMKKWADMKSKAKQAEIKRRACAKKTGGGPPPASLAPLEEKIVSVFPKEILEGITFGEDTFEAGRKADVMQKCEEDDVESVTEIEIREEKGENVCDSKTVESQPLCKNHKGSKKIASDGCLELLEVERELLVESKKRNAILESISEKMDCLIDLKKKKLDLTEKQYSIQNAAVINDMFFES